MLCPRHFVEEWLKQDPWMHPVPDDMEKNLSAAIEARDAALLHYNVEDIVRKPPPCPRCEEGGE